MYILTTALVMITLFDPIDDSAFVFFRVFFRLLGDIIFLNFEAAPISKIDAAVSEINFIRHFLSCLMVLIHLIRTANTFGQLFPNQCHYHSCDILLFDKKMPREAKQMYLINRLICK